MTWNYRIVAVEVPLFRDATVIEYGIYEVYYDDKGAPISRTENPSSFVGDTAVDVAKSLRQAALASTRPVLNDSAFTQEQTCQFSPRSEVSRTLRPTSPQSTVVKTVGSQHNRTVATPGTATATSRTLGLSTIRPSEPER